MRIACVTVTGRGPQCTDPHWGPQPHAQRIRSQSRAVLALPIDCQCGPSKRSNFIAIYPCLASWKFPQQKRMARVVPDSIHLHKHVTVRVAYRLAVAGPVHLDTHPKCPSTPPQYHSSSSNSWQTGLCTFLAIICPDVESLHRSQIEPIPSHPLNWASLPIPLLLHPTQ